VINAFRSGVDSRNIPPRAFLRRAAALKAHSFEAPATSSKLHFSHAFSFDHKDSKAIKAKKLTTSLDIDCGHSIETAV